MEGSDQFYSLCSKPLFLTVWLPRCLNSSFFVGGGVGDFIFLCIVNVFSIGRPELNSALLPILY